MATHFIPKWATCFDEDYRNPFYFFFGGSLLPRYKKKSVKKQFKFRYRVEGRKKVRNYTKKTTDNA